MAKLAGVNLKDYGISSTIGFLLDKPLERLPEYFEEWNSLAKEAPKLSSQDKILREKVQKLPLLDHERLTSYRQLRLAHVVLGAIATGYIWQEGDQGVPKVLPRALAVPWCAVSKRLGLQPVICHPTLCLANVKIKDPNRPVDLSWGGNGSSLPEGLIYEGVSEKPQKMIGGSAAQSSTMQLMDAALGVKHDQDIEEFLNQMRSYMPPKHAEFIELISRETNLRQYAQACKDVKTSYNEAVQSLVDFRSYHIQIVTKYIIITSNNESRNKDFESVSNKGTGGSSLVPFLKSIRDASNRALVE